MPNFGLMYFGVIFMVAQGHRSRLEVVQQFGRSAKAHEMSDLLTHPIKRHPTFESCEINLNLILNDDDADNDDDQ